jgi:hypothetical protein
MTRTSALAIAVCALAAPAFAQEASKPPIDWSKPVVGVDGNILQIQSKDTPRTVEVYTLDELKALGPPTINEVLQREPAQPCDPQKQGGEVLCAQPQTGTAIPVSPEMREKLSRFAPVKQE